MEINNLQKLVIDFNQKRGWKPTAQDCAKSIIIEGAELLEHFQFDTSIDNLGIDSDIKDWKEIVLEVADVLWYIFSFCNVSKIDLEKALKRKLKKLEKKYPEEMFNGQHNNEYYLQRKKEYRLTRKN